MEIIELGTAESRVAAPFGLELLEAIGGALNSLEKPSNRGTVSANNLSGLLTIKPRSPGFQRCFGSFA